MRQPQSVNPFVDTYIPVIGSDVIKDEAPNEQEEIGKDLSETELIVNIVLYSVVLDSLYEFEGVTMVYQPETDYWLIPVASLTTLTNVVHDGGKYVGLVSEPYVGDPIIGMRDFQLREFAINFGGLEGILMKLAYQIEDESGDLFYKWYESSPGTGDPIWTAPAYKNGVGNTPAQSIGEITHRGIVSRYVAP